MEETVTMRKDIVSMIFTVAALSANVACDRQGIEEPQKEQPGGPVPQGQQGAVPQGQQTEAERAQAESQKKMADDAQFNKEREDFRRNLDYSLTDADAKISTLEHKAKSAAGPEKAKLDAALPPIHTQRRAIDLQLRAIDNASRANWEET